MARIGEHEGATRTQIPQLGERRPLSGEVEGMNNDITRVRKALDVGLGLSFAVCYPEYIPTGWSGSR